MFYFITIIFVMYSDNHWFKRIPEISPQVYHFLDIWKILAVNLIIQNMKGIKISEAHWCKGLVMIKANKPKENWNACRTTVLVSVKSKQTKHLILTLGLAKDTFVLLTGKDWSTSSFFLLQHLFVICLPWVIYSNWGKGGGQRNLYNAVTFPLVLWLCHNFSLSKEHDDEQVYFQKTAKFQYISN